MYEYHYMSAGCMHKFIEEINALANNGWKLIHFFYKDCYCAILERKKEL